MAFEPIRFSASGELLERLHTDREWRGCSAALAAKNDLEDFAALMNESLGELPTFTLAEAEELARAVGSLIPQAGPVIAGEGTGRRCCQRVRAVNGSPELAGKLEPLSVTADMALVRAVGRWWVTGVEHTVAGWASLGVRVEA